MDGLEKAPSHQYYSAVQVTGLFLCWWFESKFCYQLNICLYVEHLYIIRCTGELLYSTPTHHVSVHARLVPTQQYTSSHIINKMLEMTGQLDDQLVAALSKFPSVEGLMVYETTDIFCHQATGSCCGMHCYKKPNFCIWDFLVSISQWSLLILV